MKKFDSLRKLRDRMTSNTQEPEPPRRLTTTGPAGRQTVWVTPRKECRTLGLRLRTG